MIDEGKVGHKVISVATADAEFSGFTDLESLSAHRLEMVRRFFIDYKTLEEKEVEVQDFSSGKQALEVIDNAIRKYASEKR
ncbi:inorganic diphosphatase [Roseimaritima ulvae]|uniref:inorganic diphosphatase n=1 Tax=Roseimaritima ulvae TaxID=980254 RepID=A0A5B9QME9_9BACT|nr:inorganic diphosphatase [Roseimaritima ulvae]QEG38810.1 Inorganic pyrophosphatase [Roseimaritima ulvae]